MNEVNGKIVTQDCSLSGRFWIGDLRSSGHCGCNNPHLCSDLHPAIYHCALEKKLMSQF